ncbi:uncharacterized protein LOC124927699 [Impatiens glandulifera]|uniref:uncharacterized protein LOC124927699 n=1 Tax=Impatiens glandulifera TaxID=253017 RepID=UPI001FB0D8FC|nr:uncharacterized protein LOC124927699 [Impatiens glandulifera]
MADNKGGDSTKNLPDQVRSSSSPDNNQQSTTDHTRQVAVGAQFLISPSTNFEPANPKRPRYTAAQWKSLPSPPQPPPQAAGSSSETTPSPSHSHSPRPSSLDITINKPEGDQQQQQTHQAQFRKGKYVSPVWKPNEMLWLAKAWRIQYQSISSDGLSAAAQSRGKTRADKDKEVAEFLNRHGVNRDAKTAGTKWDNMLGEFRKVYEWERGGERDHVGKSYFRLSPYERKMHRLPASFDEDVFEELSHFMGSRVRTPQTRSGGIALGVGESALKALLPPPSHVSPLSSRDDQELSIHVAGRGKQMTVVSGGIEGYNYIPVGGRGSLVGLEGSQELTAAAATSLRRIGKMRMIWEESVSLWAEDGETHRGRVKLQGSGFLNADELTFLDDSMVASPMEAFEEGSLKGFSVDRFVSGQQLKVFGRRKSSSSPTPSGSSGISGSYDRGQFSSTEPLSTIRSTAAWETQDLTEYYIGCLRSPPCTLPSLFDLSWHLQEPPSEDLRFPIRKDIYRDLPSGKELFFTTSPSTDVIDCRSIMFDLMAHVFRQNPTVGSSSRESYIGLWDDCINKVVSRFSPAEFILVRKPSLMPSSNQTIQDQWPNVAGFVKNLCLWRGEECDRLREGCQDPSSTIVDKFLWTYIDLPYVLGYYAVGCTVTFCALSRTSHDRSIVRTDLYTLDLSSPSDRLKAMVPCWRISGLLTLLADRCITYLNNISISHSKIFPYTDFERIELGNGDIIEMTPNTVSRTFSGKRKWLAVKEIYDFLEHRIPHAEYMVRSCEDDLSISLKPRGCRFKPTNCDQLIEALKYVTKALVALHDLSFMHRDLCWDKVMRRNDRESEWFLAGFEEAVGAPQIYPHNGASGRNAPEMGRGLHTVKVDLWGVGYLVKTCGLAGVPKLLKELQNRCLDHNPEQRPTAADCYHHLMQIQSSMSAAAVAAAAAAGGSY